MNPCPDLHVVLPVHLTYMLTGFARLLPLVQAAQSTGAATKAQGVEILKTYSNLRTMAQLFTQASVRDRAALAQVRA